MEIRKKKKVHFPVKSNSSEGTIIMPRRSTFREWATTEWSLSYPKPLRLFSLLLDNQSCHNVPVVSLGSSGAFYAWDGRFVRIHSKRKWEKARINQLAVAETLGNTSVSGWNANAVLALDQWSCRDGQLALSLCLANPFSVIVLQKTPLNGAFVHWSCWRLFISEFTYIWGNSQGTD